MHSLTGTQCDLLISATEMPWASARQLAAHAHMDNANAAEQCEALVALGLLQRAELGLSRFPPAIYAPTEAGLSCAAASLCVTPLRLARRAAFTESRFWALRSGSEMALEVNAMCARTLISLAPLTVRWQTFVERRHRKSPLFLHGRLVVESTDGVRAFYLLNEREDAQIWHGYGYFKYLAVWARRQEGRGDFPALLVVTTRSFRAEALLALNRMAGGQVIAFATPQRREALTRGLTRVSWYVMLPDTRIVEAQPFDLNCTSGGAAAQGVHVIPSVRALKPRQLKGDINWQGFALTVIPADLQRMSDLDGLSDEPYRVLRFVIQHPICPSSTVAEFLEMPDQNVVSHLLSLQSSGFVERVLVSPRDQRWLVTNALDRAQLTEMQAAVWRYLKSHPLSHVNEVAQVLKLTPVDTQTQVGALERGGWIAAAETSPQHAFWAATDSAVILYAHRTMQAPHRFLKRHRFFSADHERHLRHTCAVGVFFETLHRHGARRSAASRRFDAPPTGVNDGEVGSYELASFESEMMTSDWYDVLGETHVWRPDGYGVLRAGAAYTPFWLEMDGTPRMRSRRETGAWERKMRALCDYLASGRWKLRCREFPRTLIVTSLDKRTRAVILEALTSATRARDIQPPLVFVTSHDALAQTGPLGRIWFRVESGGQADYAFTGVEPPGIVQPSGPRRRNLLDDLQIAHELGLIPGV